MAHRKISMFYLEMMQSYHITFMENGRQVGRKLVFQDTEKLFEILRRCHAQIEDHQIVEYALAQGRPGSVNLRLDDDQYQKLVKAGRRVVK
jgi:hypothetical protein